MGDTNAHMQGLFNGGRGGGGEGDVSYEYSFHGPDRFFSVTHTYHNECYGEMISPQYFYNKF